MSEHDHGGGVGDSGHEPSRSFTELPAARAQNGGRAGQLIAIAIATGVAVVSIVAGRSYARPEPTPDQPAPGMTVAKGSDGVWTVTLAKDARQHAIIKTAPAAAATARWSDVIPARVVFDETRTTRLGAPLAGHVTAVFAQLGQTVTAGAPLYAVASPSLADLRNDLERATVDRDTARKNLDRIQQAVDAQVLAEKELVPAKQQVADAEVALRFAQEKLASINAGRDGSAAFTVNAPRSGVVVEKTVAVGQTVSPDTGSLMAIADLSSVWIVADLFASDVGNIQSGTRAVVILGDADGDRAGVVDQVSAVVDPERHTVPIRIKLDNPEGVLRPNAHVQVKVFDDSPEKVELPASAVMSDGEHSFVYVEKPEGVLTRRDIDVGSVVGGRVPVKHGLEPGERVVVEGVILVDNEIALDE
jgi:RND family efflux transporter MFP subunit|nr:efflux RND transporter periplasmic adaptor subunit [Kofleriaceae bacterium]